MPKTKVAVSLDREVVRRMDALVERAVFPSRSRAVEVAVREKLERLERARLARECAKLDPDFERTLAEEGLSADAGEWPTY